jgi:peptide-methionine (S)-S-oxide reductase
MTDPTPAREVATLGGGCFWCLEAVFERLQGIERVVSGYAGGTIANPSYELVCSGTTGHAEVAQVTFDPTVIAYREVLETFFAFHDPTQLNRQGADVGTQYRSVIFYHSEAQRAVAEELMARLTRDHVYDRPIVTQLEPLAAFYPAERYHQEYFRRNEGQPYCQAVIAPKVAKLRHAYRDRLKPDYR